MLMISMPHLRFDLAPSLARRGLFGADRSDSHPFILSLFILKMIYIGTQWKRENGNGQELPTVAGFAVHFLRRATGFP
jgi:hypothetical protein